MDTFSSLTLIAILLGIVLTILWICLPFAVFGIKQRLDTLIRQNKALIEQGRQ